MNPRYFISYDSPNRAMTTQTLLKREVKEFTAEEIKAILEDYKRIRRQIRWNRRRLQRALVAKNIEERLSKVKCEQCSNKGCVFCIGDRIKAIGVEEVEPS